MGEIRILLELQQIEVKLAKLQKKLKELPVFAEFQSLQTQTADAKEALGCSEGKLGEHEKRLRRLEGRLQAVEGEWKEVQERLYGDTAQSAKELEQLEKKAATLQREKSEQEEAILLAMENREELETARLQAKSEHNSLQKSLREKQRTGNEEISLIKEEILALRKERDSLLSQVSEALIKEYKEMYQRFQGRPLAVVEVDICTGCRVSVSSAAKAKLYDPACKIYCDNCGRLLVPFS